MKRYLEFRRASSAVGFVAGLIVSIYTIVVVLAGLVGWPHDHAVLASWVIIGLGIVVVGLLVWIDQLLVGRLKLEDAAQRAAAEIHGLQTRPSERDRALFDEILTRLPFETGALGWLRDGDQKVWRESDAQPFYDMRRDWVDGKQYFDDSNVDAEFEKLKDAIKRITQALSSNSGPGLPGGGGGMKDVDGETLYYLSTPDNSDISYERYSTIVDELQEAWKDITEARQTIERVGRGKKL